MAKSDDILNLYGNFLQWLPQAHTLGLVALIQDTRVFITEIVSTKIISTVTSIALKPGS